MHIIEFIFSPTGGTEKIADAVAKNLSNHIEKIDLSKIDIDFSNVTIHEEDVCLIAAPSFGGRVPSVVGERLAKINGNGAKTILLAVYGNREFEDTLLELNELAAKSNFVPVAGIGAIAEHSIIRQFATKRPDTEDLQELKSFTDKIIKVLQSNEKNTLSLPGNYPYKEYNGIPAKPIADETCGNCGLCAEKCPVGAIPKENPSQIDSNICISCMRCVSICPKQARHVNPAIIEAFTQKLAPVCSSRKQNTLYI